MKHICTKFEVSSFNRSGDRLEVTLLMVSCSLRALKELKK